MLSVKSFVCNPYGENTYLVYNETGECAIIDPGMYGAEEQNQVTAFITGHKLRPVVLLNTHCHIDHVLGNKFICDLFNLLPQFHEGELPVLSAVPAYAPQMGFHYDVSPLPENFLGETGSVFIGDDELKLIFAPGHSPAHLCFYSEADRFILAGDVLFDGSIGRTDLPGGNHQQLTDNIRTKLFPLPDDCIVYPGHGGPTSIGHEKRTNPFLT